MLPDRLSTRAGKRTPLPRADARGWRVLDRKRDLTHRPQANGSRGPTAGFGDGSTPRAQISLMRGVAAAADVNKLDLSGLMRQQAGKVGLGTSQQRITPPTG